MVNQSMHGSWGLHDSVSQSFALPSHVYKARLTIPPIFSHYRSCDTHHAPGCCVGVVVWFANHKNGSWAAVTRNTSKYQLNLSLFALVIVILIMNNEYLDIFFHCIFFHVACTAWIDNSVLLPNKTMQIVAGSAQRRSGMAILHWFFIFFLFYW